MHVASRVLLAASLAAFPGLAVGQGVALRAGVGAAPAPSTVADAPSAVAPATAGLASPPTSAQESSAPPDGQLGVGPSLAAATVGLRANTGKEDLTAQEAAQRAAHHGGLGTSGALMIVGAAAFIAGLIIGGGAGTAIAIGGAVIGLYGLYLYLQ
jgi:hypothetical protein